MKLFEHRDHAIRAIATWTSITLGVLAIVGLVFFTAESAYARLYENRMYPGIRIYGVRVDGMTREEARETVQKEVDLALQKGFRFMFMGQEVQLQAASGPDVSQELIRYDVTGAVDRAFFFGRQKTWIQNGVSQLALRVRPANVNGDIYLDTNGVHDALLLAYEEKIKPPQDAAFTYVFDERGDVFIHIENERSGYALEIGHALDTLKDQAAGLAFEPILLQEVRAEPTVFRDELEPLLPEVEGLLNRPAITLTYQGRPYRFDPEAFSKWIAPIRGEDDSLSIGFDPMRFHDAVVERAPDIERDVTNGSLKIVDGDIDAFTAGQNGIAINTSSTLAAIWEFWPEETTFPIETDVIPAALLGDDPERLGIREIIGVGTSDFSGSPANRRHNIRLGVERVNGTLVPPGEEFSMLQTLGSIDGANGWLPELVIKGNKTIPEYGGGLCQIGTTAFRGAMDTGLEITERRNHSYRVRYYEPAGTDATLYEPAPDFRFRNDTGHHILINGYIQGDEVVFEFWGTRDGRAVAPLEPVIYNITAPPPTKLIETLDLPPGVKKCTESAHAGADASLTYTVTYADGSTHEEVFTSHYRPWQAVCLIGVEALSDTSTSGTSLGE